MLLSRHLSFTTRTASLEPARQVVNERSFGDTQPKMRLKGGSGGGADAGGSTSSNFVKWEAVSTGPQPPPCSSPRVVSCEAPTPFGTLRVAPHTPRRAGGFSRVSPLAHPSPHECPQPSSLSGRPQVPPFSSPRRKLMMGVVKESVERGER